MPESYNYPAAIERRRIRAPRCVVSRFRLGCDRRRDPRRGAWLKRKDLLRELIATTMHDGDALPAPSPARKRWPVVVPPVQIALKAALYEAWREAEISQRRFARDLGIAESEVRRMLNPDHATKVAKIDWALRHLGKRFTVTVGEAT